MRYAIWTFAIVDGIKLTPENAKGIAFLDDEESLILGTLDDSFDINKNKEFEVQEIDKNEADERLKNSPRTKEAL